MKYKNIIIPVLFLIALVIIIDRVAVMNPSLVNGVTTQNNNGNGAANDADDSDDSVMYFCKEGTVTAQFDNQTAATGANGTNAGDSMMSLALADGREFILPQVVSGSGIRYEKGDIAFIGKGDSAMVMEKNKAIYSDCVAGNVASDDSGTLGTDSKYAFTNEAETFSFAYPKQFMVVGDEIELSQQWRANADTMGDRLVTVVIPRSFQPKTNFSEATFVVGSSADPKSIELCLRASNGETPGYNPEVANPAADSATNPVSAGRVTINGVAFSKYNLGDAGAGNYYDTTSYRTMRDGLCYAVEYTIHSTNLGNYDPSQGISEFDRAKVQGILEDMVKSFKFIQS